MRVSTKVGDISLLSVVDKVYDRILIDCLKKIIVQLMVSKKFNSDKDCELKAWL